MNEAVQVLEQLNKEDPSFKIEFDTFEWRSEYYPRLWKNDDDVTV